MGHSRLQAPFTVSKENPHLVPFTPQVDINSGRGRFQQVSLGMNSAEERTRIPSQVIVEQTLQAKPVKTETKETTTVVTEDTK